MIPKQYTCDGIDISPPLRWEFVPDSTKSLALICEDPDAPMGTWVHWVIYNLPATKRELEENILQLETLADGSKQGMNDFGRIGYCGPCPPSAIHRYYFILYALDTKLNLASGITKAQLKKYMRGHVLAKGHLMGKYKRYRDIL